MVRLSERFVLASEAGRLLGLSPQRVRQLVDAGRLAARRGPHGMRMIEKRAVEALIEQRRRSIAGSNVAKAAEGQGSAEGTQP